MFRVRIVATKRTPGFDNAERIYVESLNAALTALGKHLQKSLRGRVRHNVGDEAKNVKFEVTGQGLNKTLTVFGDLIQLWIDEYGLAPGTFPPWGVGSRLFKYVTKRGLHRTPLTERFNAARKRGPRSASHVRTRRPGPKRATRVAPVAKGRKRVGRSRRTVPAASKQQRSPQAQRRQKAIQRFAFLVARAIFERGIRASKPIARTFEANRAKILKDVANAFVRATNKINRGG